MRPRVWNRFSAATPLILNPHDQHVPTRLFAVWYPSIIVFFLAQNTPFELSVKKGKDSKEAGASTRVERERDRKSACVCVCASA